MFDTLGADPDPNRRRVRREVFQILRNIIAMVIARIITDEMLK